MLNEKLTIGYMLDNNMILGDLTNEQLKELKNNTGILHAHFPLILAEESLRLRYGRKSNA